MGILERLGRGSALGSPFAPSGGGGGGISWSDPVDSNITVSANNTYDLGTDSDKFRRIHSDIFRASNGFALTQGVTRLGDWRVTQTSPNSGVAQPALLADTAGVTTWPMAIMSQNSTTATQSKSIHIETGNNTSTGNSGNIALLIGSVVSGTQGSFRFLRVGDAPNIGDVWTCSAVDGTGYWAPAAGGGANTSLSNLVAPTAVNQSIIPDTNITHSLGTLAARFDKAFFEYAYLDVATGLTPQIWGGDLPALVLDGDATEAASQQAVTIVMKNSYSDGLLNIFTQDFNSADTTAGFYWSTGWNTGAGNTGQIDIYSGNASNGNSGDVNIVSGGAPNGSSGQIILQVGADSAGSNARLTMQDLTFNFRTDQLNFGQGGSGSPVLFKGESQADMTFSGGDNTSNVLSSGAVIIKSGDLTNAANSSDSASVTITTGSVAGSGNSGEIKFIKPDVTPIVGQVWTCTNADGSGYWAPAASGGDLWSDPVDANIVPDVDFVRNVGSSALYFNAVFTRLLNTRNNGAGLGGISLKTTASATKADIQAPDASNFSDGSGSKRYGLRIINQTSVSSPTFRENGNILLQTVSNGSTSALSGDIYLKTGNHTVAGAVNSTGPIELVTGNNLGTAASANSGDIIFTTGSVVGGTRGSVVFNAGLIDASGAVGPFRSPNLSADPASPQNGDIWYNTTTNQLKAYVNGSVVILA